ncbi:insulin receptor substrate 2-B-like [Crotalus adamanteus]|uniref:Insulin receptor substrate 2-B-like n=1 Tax=Crotalus adamanteus TaxID=8729 RepID=A0AAW1AVF8_CROAD
MLGPAGEGGCTALEGKDEAAGTAAGATAAAAAGTGDGVGGSSRLAANEEDQEPAESAPCPPPPQPPHHLLLLLRKSPSSSLCLVQEEDALLPGDPAALGRAGAPATPLGRSGPPVTSARGCALTPPASITWGDDVRKCGYLRKQKHGHKRYFVLRAESHLGPARLEYYDSEKKFKSSLRAAAAAAAGGNVALCCPSPKRVIPLYQCFTVSRRADAKHKHIIALYTKDEYFAMVAENEPEQEGWYQAISELMSQSKRGFLEQEDQTDQQLDDDDEHYGATLRPGTVFKEVWQVNVKPKGLGQTKNLTGVYRLCLSSKAIHLVKLNTEVPSVHLQLMNIRRCGHSENFFFIEVGRSASIGPEGSPSSLGSSSDHRQSPLSDYMSVDLDVQSPKAAKELSNSLTDISIYANSSLSRNLPDADYARLSFGTACVSTACGRIDDYTEMTFNMAATPPGPFATESKNGLKIDSPPSIVNRLCIVDQYAGHRDFPLANPDPPVVPKVIRADPQGRRRHSSETFSSAATVTTSSSFFTDSSKRHSSASFDNVWLKPEEHISDGHESKMSRDTSTGFQNGLNYIALNLRENSLNCEESPSTPNCHLSNGTLNLESGVYVSIDFSRSDSLKCSSARKD